MVGMLRWLNLAAKVALVALLLHAVAFPDLPQYDGKGIGARLFTYPIGGLIVPLAWFLGMRRRLPRYPHLIDLCAISPFVIDTAGNAANLYNTIDWWDDLMHFITWIPWVLAFGLAIREVRGVGGSSLARWNVFALTAGFGAITHIIWELLEYVAFIRDNPDELRGAYVDTLGDLLLSLTGSFTGALLTATVLWNVGRLFRIAAAPNGQAAGQPRTPSAPSAPLGAATSPQ
jgi:hypothetical protein